LEETEEGYLPPGPPHPTSRARAWKAAEMCGGAVLLPEIKKQLLKHRKCV